MSFLRFSVLLCLFLFSVSSDGWLYPRLRKIHQKPEVEVAADQWFTQVLDHFNPSDTRTWQQRYFTNDTYFSQSETSPIFLNIGGESTADPIWISDQTQMMVYAQRYGALTLMLEHRYYGNSHPTDDMSTENLYYLSTDQALADLANFIQQMNVQYGFTDSNKWIVFGGSYPGVLAADVRMKYPQLVYGAIASSAPVQNQLSYEGYNEVVQQSLEYFSPGCSDVIRQATEQIDEIMAEEQTGWDSLSEQFSLCSPLDGTNEMDVIGFYSALENSIDGVVQYNLDNRAFEGAIGTNITIDVICEILQDESKGSELNRYVDVNNLLMETYGESCMTYRYEVSVAGLKVTNWAAGLTGARQYMFQSCREWGSFQTDGPVNIQPFGDHVPIEYFTQMCQDVFGAEYTQEFSERAVDWYNTAYGGWHIKSSRIAFPNGSIDPWHPLGVLTNTTAGSIAMLIEGTAHCADMYPSTPDDLPQLTQTRQQISDLIGEWLSQ